MYILRALTIISLFVLIRSRSLGAHIHVEFRIRNNLVTTHTHSTIPRALSDNSNWICIYLFSCVSKSELCVCVCVIRSVVRSAHCHVSMSLKLIFIYISFAPCINIITTRIIIIIAVVVDDVLCVLQNWMCKFLFVPFADWSLYALRIRTWITHYYLCDEQWS